MKSFSMFCEEVVLDEHVQIINRMVQENLLDPADAMTYLVEALTSSPEDEDLFLEFDPLSMAVGAGGYAAYKNRDKIKDWFKNKFQGGADKSAAGQNATNMTQQMSQPRYQPGTSQGPQNGPQNGAVGEMGSDDGTGAFHSQLSKLGAFVKNNPNLASKYGSSIQNLIRNTQQGLESGSDLKSAPNQKTFGFA